MLGVDKNKANSVVPIDALRLAGKQSELDCPVMNEPGTSGGSLGLSGHGYSSTWMGALK